MRHIARTLIVCLLVAVAAAGQQKTFDFSSLETVVKEELQQTRTPGAAVAVVLGDEVIYAKGFGVASVETEEAVRPEMLFRLGSTTKMFTAATLVTLAEQGKINLKEPIGKYVQSLSPKIAQLTAHQLLSHSSGLLDEAPMFGSNDEEALGKEVRSWKDDRFFTEPGKIYSYSNPGFWLAGFISETISGKPFADEVAGVLFEPLGMSRTTFRPMIAMTYPMAQGHDLENGRLKVVRPAANNAASWPAGSIFSSVNDLSRWVMAFVNNGQIDGKQAVMPGVIAKLQSPNSDIPGSANKYAYGLQVGTWRGIRVAEHSGSRSGYGSVIRMAPEQKFGVVILANRTGVSLNRTATRAMEIVLSPSPAPPTPRRTAVPMTADEMAKYAGVYSQGTRQIEVVLREGKLMLRQDGQERPIAKLADNQFGVAAGNEFTAQYIFVQNGSGTIEYLHTGGRSWRKIR